jgi:hypothetical protein
MLQTLAISKLTPPFILNWLSYDNDWGGWIVRWRVARNPNTPPETLDRLANDEDSSVREGVAYNLNTSPETLDLLANDKKSHVRCMVAQNPNTSPESLERLANDECLSVREFVIHNSNNNNPLKMDILKFLDWIDTASIGDLESLTVS